jgi:xanthine dehydrogenase accessory factor
MLLRADGRHLGSVSGGCIEEDLLNRYRNLELGPEFPVSVDYGVDAQRAREFGLPCGGRLELVIEQVADASIFEQLLERISQGQLIARRTNLLSGEVALHPVSADDEFYYDEKTMQQVFGPAWQMLLIGAGHLSFYVASIAMMLGYRVTVCDPREDYLENWSVEGAVLTQEMPDDVVKQIKDVERCVVLALTHDPKLDDMALWEALQSRAFYIGALGSEKNNNKRRERLSQLGLSESQIQRLQGPVGLPIGSHTPEEIAVSIVAGITAARHGIKLEAV